MSDIVDGLTGIMKNMLYICANSFYIVTTNAASQRVIFYQRQQLEKLPLEDSHTCAYAVCRYYGLSENLA